MTDIQKILRNLPAIDRVLAADAMEELRGAIPHTLLLEAAQEAVALLRGEILRDPSAADVVRLAPEEVGRRAASIARKKVRPSLRPVINATGTLLHTNLGRAPLSQGALAAVADVARSYSNLELDLETGKRGHRYSHVEDLLCRLTGAEAATVVNNNAGAVLLALTALAKGKEAIVSRGELVEIGGAFRVPDVMEAGGVCLKEVGTTNKTHLADYRDAVGDETALLLKVHTSNYRIVGFTAVVESTELVALGREKGLCVMEDLGSGMLFDLSPHGLPKEPTVKEAVAAGIDVVTFSGDKLLGGPQAGLIVGRRDAIEAIRRHPMARALRIDKLTLAAIEATLRHYLDHEEAMKELPVLRMLSVSATELEETCFDLAARIRELCAEAVDAEVVPEPSAIGGGALPLTELPGFAVALSPKSISVDALAERLRKGEPPVVARIRDDRLILNPRTLAGSEAERLVAALAEAFTRTS